MGNLTADIIRSEFQADFGLANGGCLRANQRFEKGQITLRFVSQILPMIDQIACVQVTGKILKKILENGLSLWPKYDGRWPLTSGLSFKFDPSKPPGDRIVEGSLTTTEGVPIDPEKYYSLAAKYFLTTGKDGYSAFQDPSVIYPPNFSHDGLPVFQEVLKNWLKNFRKNEKELERMPARAKKIFQQRLKYMHTSVDNRDAESGYIKICPRVEGRIINVG